MCVCVCVRVLRYVHRTKALTLNPKFDPAQASGLKKGWPVCGLVTWQLMIADDKKTCSLLIYVYMYTGTSTCKHDALTYIVPHILLNIYVLHNEISLSIYIYICMYIIM